MPLIKEIIESTKFIQRTEGWKAIPRYLFHPFYEGISGYIMLSDLSNTIPPVPPKLALEIREATPADAPRFQKILPMFRIRRFMQKMEAGERCAIGLLNGDVIYYAWASIAGQPTAAESPIKLGPKDVYFWGAYTMPEYRRGGVSASVSSYHADLMRQLGYETGYHVVKFKNVPSLALCKKLHLKIIGRINGVRIGRWRLCKTTLNDVTLV
mgnify:CR=1 FL=1